MCNFGGAVSGGCTILYHEKKNKKCGDVVDLVVAEQGATAGESMSFHSGLCGREMVDGDELNDLNKWVIRLFCVMQWQKRTSNVLADRTIAEVGVTVGKIFVLMKIRAGEQTHNSNESAMVAIITACDGH